MIYTFESYWLDSERRELHRGSDLVSLEPQVFDFLQYLIRNRQRVVSRDNLIAAVWNGRIVSEATLSSRLNAVRCAIGDSGAEQRLVRTLRRKGVRFVGVVHERPGPDESGAAKGANERGALVSPDRPSIGVLPFKSFSADRNDDFFSDGITEDITAALCKLEGFFVIARNTMFTYKDRPTDVRAIGREIGVRYLLEGSVRKAGNRIRVTAQLLEAETGNHLWAERYDRHLEDIFAIQDEITASIVGRISPELLAAEHVRLRRKPPDSLIAWGCVVRALFHSSQQSDEESRHALTLLDRALNDDPDYAQARGMKAWILVFRAFQGWEDMRTALVQAKTLIAHAMAVDNDEIWAYLAQGMVGCATRDNGLAIGALTRAVTLSPSSVSAHGLLGVAHAFGGRSTEALACIDNATRLSPRDNFLSAFELYNAFAHFQAARYDLGLRFAQQAHRVRPRQPYPLLLGAACAGHIGETETGAILLRELMTIVPSISAAWVEATSPYVLAEDRARVTEGLSRAGLH